jgi:hypothetical protein
MLRPADRLKLLAGQRGNSANEVAQNVKDRTTRALAHPDELEGESNEEASGEGRRERDK